MRSTRIVALVVGCLAVVPGVGLLVGGGALGIASLVARDAQGYFDANLDRLETDTAAITSDEVTFATDPGSPDWLMDRLDIDVRLRVSAASEEPVFVGIARTADVDAYLAGVAHAQVTDVDDEWTPRYANVPGNGVVATAPSDEDFWVAAASGTGDQEVIWEAEGGRWTAVVMNADGSPGVRADANVAAKAGFVVPLALTLLGTGLLLTAIAVVLIVVGARGMRAGADAHDGTAPTTFPPPLALAGSAPPIEPETVRLQAWLDPDLSRWQWLVKWFLAIPHFVALALLWIVFAVTSVVAWFAILFTGRYPRSLFDVNLGVLRWSWRVQYYATSGGLGTDRYPPFSLGQHPEYPATLDIAYPEHLSRGLVLVKSWLLALPHLLLLSLLAGGIWGGTGGDGWATAGGGVLGLLVLFAAVALLVTGRYPRSLFDLVVGINRWMYRVIAYVALMTDEYPPFRLDQGGAEPAPTAPLPPVVPRALVDA